MYELEFYSKDEPPLLSYLFIHPLIYLYLYEPLDIYFILYVITHRCYMDIFAQIAMHLAMRISCKPASVSCCYAPSHYRAFLSAIVSPVQAGSRALLLCFITL